MSDSYDELGKLFDDRAAKEAVERDAAEKAKQHRDRLILSYDTGIRNVIRPELERVAEIGGARSQSCYFSEGTNSNNRSVRLTLSGSPEGYIEFSFDASRERIVVRDSVSQTGSLWEDSQESDRMELAEATQERVAQIVSKFVERYLQAQKGRSNT
jgi:hypothetical protein